MYSCVDIILCTDHLTPIIITAIVVGGVLLGLIVIVICVIIVVNSRFQYCLSIDFIVNARLSCVVREYGYL